MLFNFKYVHQANLKYVFIFEWEIHERNNEKTIMRCEDFFPSSYRISQSFSLLVLFENPICKTGLKHNYFLSNTIYSVCLVCLYFEGFNCGMQNKR